MTSADVILFLIAGVAAVLPQQCSASDSDFRRGKKEGGVDILGDETAAMN